jgi:hypothetical protein
MAFRGVPAVYLGRS